MAVSFAVWLRGRLKASTLLLFWVTQFLGSLVGALAGRYVARNDVMVPEKDANVSDGRALSVELIWSAAIVYVFLHVCTTRAQAGNSFYGIAVGLFYLDSASAAVYSSGGCPRSRWRRDGGLLGLWLHRGLRCHCRCVFPQRRVGVWHRRRARQHPVDGHRWAVHRRRHWRHLLRADKPQRVPHGPVRGRVCVVHQVGTAGVYVAGLVAASVPCLVCGRTIHGVVLVFDFADLSLPQTWLSFWAR